MASPHPITDDLTRALDIVGDLISGIGTDQWSAPTPCTGWAVRDVVGHLVGTNNAMIAVLSGEAPPPRGTPPPDEDLAGAYRDTGAALRAAVGQPGVLDRTVAGPLGTATGSVRLRWRVADLLVHAWDLGQATGQPAALPDDLVAAALAFVRAELTPQARPGRFDPPQPVAPDAPLLDQLVAFSGRRLPA
jgi:uncharacterized protein (TIGR03086 family)